MTSFYLTLENENYIHPAMPKGVEEDIIKGMYKLHSTKNPTVRLLGSGPLLNEVIEAANILKDEWNVDPGIWNVTSFTELRREAEKVDRWNIINPGEKPKKSHIEKALNNNEVPTIAVSDYVKMSSEQISPYVSGPFYSLGTDGFGRSDTRENLRHFFEVDRYILF
jgi:pyruvate dehydrogenase E1 component